MGWNDVGSDRTQGPWIPYEQIDTEFGADFVPEVVYRAPFGITADRPVVLWNVSSITVSNFTAERRP